MSKPKPLKVFVENNDSLIQKMFNNRGYYVVTNPKVADFCVFSGGADIDPDLYNQKRLEVTKGVDFNRDQKCETLFELFAEKPKIGICRGAQFLNVQCGGSMYQDVDNHLGNHEVFVQNFSESLGEVTSTHHQMMIPERSAEIIAVAKKSTRRVREGFSVVAGRFYNDAEIVFYKKEKSLCFQPHPEYGHKNTEELFWASVKFALPEIYVEPENKEAT